MKPLADAVNGAEKLVFYAHCFSCAETGPADIPLDALDPQKPLVTGVADKPGKPDQRPSWRNCPAEDRYHSDLQRSSGICLTFKTEWKGRGGIHTHHKFVVCDFNHPDPQKPVVFTGWSNMAAGGEQGNGDNLIEIRNPNVVVAYAMQTVSIFAHYGFRNRMKRAEQNQRRETSVSLPRKRGPLVEAELPVQRHQMPRPEAVCGLACRS